jgi:hypothetical protein
VKQSHKKRELEGKEEEKILNNINDMEIIIIFLIKEA